MVETARSMIFLFCPVNFFYNVAAHVQHIGGAVVELQTSLGDSQLLGGTDQQPGIQLLLQGLYMGTDGGLSQNCLNSIG